MSVNFKLFPDKSVLEFGEQEKAFLQQQIDKSEKFKKNIRTVVVVVAAILFVGGIVSIGLGAGLFTFGVAHAALLGAGIPAVVIGWDLFAATFVGHVDKLVHKMTKRPDLKDLQTKIQTTSKEIEIRDVREWEFLKKCKKEHPSAIGENWQRDW